MVDADGFERLEIRLARLRRLREGRDVLTQEIERSSDVLLLEFIEHPNAFFKGLARHKPRSESLGHGGVLHPVTEPALLRKVEKCASKHRVAPALVDTPSDFQAPRSMQNSRAGAFLAAARAATSHVIPNPIYREALRG